MELLVRAPGNPSSNRVSRMCLFNCEYFNNEMGRAMIVEGMPKKHSDVVSDWDGFFKR